MKHSLLIFILLLGGCASSSSRLSYESNYSEIDQKEHSRCDLDKDGDCDEDDLATFSVYYGRCFADDEEHSSGYKPLLDVDRDGCITSFDQKLLFPSESQPQ